jgi:predicted DCC family thiol-disulfide oxidoreductase YuxK
MTEKTIVYFDGSCPLCRAEIALYRTSNGADAVAFEDVSSITGPFVSPDLPKSQAMARFHVRTPDGTLESGAAGFAALWVVLPRWRWLGRVIRLPLLGAVAETAYRLFLKVRPRLQRLVQLVSKLRARIDPAPKP